MEASSSWRRRTQRSEEKGYLIGRVGKDIVFRFIIEYIVA